MTDIFPTAVASSSKDAHLYEDLDAFDAPLTRISSIEFLEGIEPPPAILPSARLRSGSIVDATPFARPVAGREEACAYVLEGRRELGGGARLVRLVPSSSQVTLPHPVPAFHRVEVSLPGAQRGPEAHYPVAVPDPSSNVLTLLVDTFSALFTAAVSSPVRVSVPHVPEEARFKYSPGLARRIGMLVGKSGLGVAMQVVKAVREGGEGVQVDLVYVDEGGEEEVYEEREGEGVRRWLEKEVGGDDSVRVRCVREVEAETVLRWLPPPARDVKILVCASSEVVEKCKEVTEVLGYERAREASRVEDQIFVF